jgi:hypothetical protein
MVQKGIEWVLLAKGYGLVHAWSNVDVDYQIPFPFFSFYAQ